MAASCVTGTGFSPAARPLYGIVQMSRWLPPAGRPQYAMRRPCGETAGWIASRSAESLRVLPLCDVDGPELARPHPAVGA